VYETEANVVNNEIQFDKNFYTNFIPAGGEYVSRCGSKYPSIILEEPPSAYIRGEGGMLSFE
jgi:hypothetical protein